MSICLSLPRQFRAANSPGVCCRNSSTADREEAVSEEVATLLRWTRAPAAAETAAISASSVDTQTASTPGSEGRVGSITEGRGYTGICNRGFIFINVMG